MRLTLKQAGLLSGDVVFRAEEVGAAGGTRPGRRRAGVARVARPAEVELDHPRSGELIVLSESDAWFTYYYWLDDALAPDFSRTVDIHRKPGYDPCELFMTSKVRAMSRLAQKKIGMRYKMDVIPLDAHLVRGSHGLHTQPEKGPLVVGSGELPDDMRNFKAYVQRLLA